MRLRPLIVASMLVAALLLAAPVLAQEEEPDNADSDASEQAEVEALRARGLTPAPMGTSIFDSDELFAQPEDEDVEDPDVAAADDTDVVMETERRQAEVEVRVLARELADDGELELFLNDIPLDVTIEPGDVITVRHGDDVLLSATIDELIAVDADVDEDEQEEEADEDEGQQNKEEEEDSDNGDG